MLQNIDLYKSEDLDIAMLQKVSVKKNRNTDTQTRCSVEHRTCALTALG